MNDLKIKPCPFCGSKEILFNGTIGLACWLSCNKCDAESGGVSVLKEEAIKDWNRRKEVKGYAALLTEADKNE